MAGSSSIWTSLARLGQWRIIGVTLQLGWCWLKLLTLTTVNFYKWLQLLQEITLCTQKIWVYLSGGTCDDKTYKSCESVGTMMFKTRCKSRTNTLIIMSATNTWLSKVVGAWTHATSCNIISFMASLANWVVDMKELHFLILQRLFNLGTSQECLHHLDAVKFYNRLTVAGINLETYIGYDGSLYQQMDGWEAVQVWA
jgi:hypothetical protein